MEYIQEITLDINSNQAYTVVSAKQGDSDSRGIHVYYTASGEEYQVNPNNSVALRVRKPDGHVIFNDASVQPDGSVIAMFSYQTLIVAGRAYADLVEFNPNGQTISTVSFILNIMSSPDINANAALSSDEFLYLKTFIDRGNSIIGLAQEWAVGSNGDQPVSQDNPAYNNNAKFYAEQGQAFASTAGYIAQAWAIGSRGNEPLEPTDPAYHNNALWWATAASSNADRAALSRQGIEDMTVTASPSTTASVDKTVNSSGIVNLNFNLPQGEIGDAVFITFDVDYSDGKLYMYKPQPNTLLQDINFAINSNGYLEVTVNAN